MKLLFAKFLARIVLIFLVTLAWIMTMSLNSFVGVVGLCLGLGLMLGLVRSLHRSVDDILRTDLRATREAYETRIRDLAADRAQLSAILSSMVEAVVAVNSQGHIIAVNAALCSLFGINPEAARGKPFLEVLRQGQLAEILRDVLERHRLRIDEISLFSPESRVFESHAVPIMQDGSILGALLVLHDITQIRKLEQMRREFVANVSHELRTPLASIKGFAETLKLGALKDTTRRLEFVSEIENEAEAMIRLVEDLLDISAIESGRRPPVLEAVSLADMAREVANQLRSQARRRNISINVENGEGSTIPADRGQMRQVFANLIDNAIKFNKEGGSVTISFSSREDGGIATTVKDTGVGIPQADLPRIFERFYRVDKARSRELGGTGLGLAIVKHIVESHGGTVSVESVEGQGSRFRIDMPSQIKVRAQ